MAIKITLTNSSQITNKVVTKSDQDVKINRIIYQYLRSLAKAKTIVVDVADNKVPKELVALFEEFNNKQLGLTISPEAEALDEYLGSLGDTTEFFYDKDIISIPAWLNIEEQSPFRNVVYQNTTAVDNVIYFDGVDTYNVVHRTGNS